MQPRVLVIIPAYNEQECILTTARMVEDQGFDYVVINDGSVDRTLEICKDNGLHVLDLPLNLGIGGAIQAGHMFAKQHGYDIDIQFDGDGQHDAGYLQALVDAVANGSDIVVGSRFLSKTDGFQSTAMRKIGIAWLRIWIELFTGLKITDPTSGFRACGSKAIELFCNYYPSDYPEPESIVVANKAGLSVSEISVVMHERQGGVSSISALSGAYYMVKVSLAILIDCLSGKRHRSNGGI